jgi:dual oxidase
MLLFLNISNVDSHLTRKVPASYSDGVYMMGGLNRPNPRKLSEFFMKGPDGLGSVMNRTALFAFFGKFLLFNYCRC